ncbi:uncharacterized protein LOC141631893 [Silene latifolia]|uniref:uncharacterized protein LOC141631893 n=1 Tax=Silene latifolia TaxID=37657 RepID=UPI003D7820F0
MNNFRYAVDDCGLRDLPYEGYAFTFDNGQEGDANRQCRLDRAMVNGEWSDKFPYAKLLHLDREWSDHAPIKALLNGRRDAEGRAPKMFRFEQIWVGHDGCEDVVKRAWETEDGELISSLQRCAIELQNWKGVSIGKVMRDLQKKRKRLKWLNEGGRSVREVNERRKIVKDIADLLRQEESFWRQRSRALWLRDGDRNTKKFHQKVSQRKEKNHIAKLIDERGRVLLIGIEGRVTDAMNEGLREEYRGDEVVEALNQMHPLKAPGLDGINGLFYQTYWHIVGPAVTRCVLNILNGAPFPEGMNETNIVLIPKKEPDKMQ